MKRLFSATLVSVFLISAIFGASTALAKTDERAQEFTVFVECETENVTTTTTCVVDDELMKELDLLLKMLEEAESEGDQELIEALQAKIQVIKEEISNACEKPAVTEESKNPRSLIEKPTVTGTSEGTVTDPARQDACTELKAMEEKKKHYLSLYDLPDEKLIGKGYSGGKEDIENIISNLEETINRLRIECEAGVAIKAEGTEETTTEAVTVRPVAVESGGEITDYYRRRIAEIATGTFDIERQIASLKELRNEIDELIEELIKSKAEISAEEVSGLVSKIEVRPGEVKMDNVVVKTVDKSVVARIADKDLEIKPTEAQVILCDGNLEIKAPELSIEDDVLRVGDSEVVLNPGMVMENIKIEPKEIELREEGAKAVYKIKTDESRKLIGLFPIKVEKTLTVDANETEVKINKEERPWWAFLTVE